MSSCPQVAAGRDSRIERNTQTTRICRARRAEAYDITSSVTQKQTRHSKSKKQQTYKEKRTKTNSTTRNATQHFCERHMRRPDRSRDKTGLDMAMTTKSKAIHKVSAAVLAGSTGVLVGSIAGVLIKSCTTRSYALQYQQQQQQQPGTEKDMTAPGQRHKIPGAK